MVIKHLIMTTFSSLILSLFFLSTLFAGTVEKEVLVRNENGKLKTKKVLLTGLKNTQSFEGEFFKIVLAKSDRAILFNDPKYSFRAATVYHHLTEAREFFVAQFGEESVDHLGRMIVRIEMPNGYSKIGHFMSDEVGHAHNNALTIPASDHMRDSDFPAWNTEIWFRPGKKIKRETFSQAALSSLDSPLQREAMLVRMFESSVIQLARSLATHDIAEIPWDGHLSSLAVSFGMTVVLPKFFKFFGKFFKSTFYLDTAMLPEIVYHEFVHAALADKIRPRNSTAVTEGLANYFAARIADSDEVAFKAGKYSKGFSSKSVRNKTMYSVQLENAALAQSSFTFKLLWKYKGAIGSSADKLIYEALDGLNLASDIKYDLVNELVKQIESSRLPEKNYLKMKFANELDGIGL